MRAGMEDPQRIDAARRLLAQAPGEAIDRLAALSARLLGAAHAQVSIFTDEQVSLTPRAPRRPHRDALAAAHVRRRDAGARRSGAYLGAPIEVDGARIGVLCVYDDEPFEWTPHDLEVLRELAIAIAAELERGALVAELESSTVRLDLGFAAANIGSFDWDLRTNELHWDERLMELFGYTAADYVPHIDSFNARLHPDDRERVGGAIASAIERCGDYAADYRVVHDDGAVRWVAARGRVLCGDDGEPARMLGAAYDTTAVHTAAERLGRVLETMSTAFITLDLDWCFTYVNGAAERMLGRPRDQLVGQRHRSRSPRRRTSAYRRAIETGEPQSFEHYHPALDALVRRPRHAERRRASASTSTTSPAACVPSRTPRGSRASARTRSPPAAPRPAACRSSAPPAPGSPARWRSTSWSASSPTSSSTGSGTAWSIALADRVLTTRRRPAAGFRVAHVAPARGAAWPRRPGRAIARAASSTRGADGRRAARAHAPARLARPDARRDHRRWTRSPARSTGAC